MYSSVGDDERRRANEIQEERDNLEYQKFDGNDVTATMENAGDTLGATQALETLNQVTDTTPRADAVPVKKGGKKYNRVAIDTTGNDELINEYQDEDDKLAIAAQEVEMQALRMKNGGKDGKLLGIRDDLRRQDSLDSDAVYGVSKEIYNFSSAPQNAKSALEGNRGLQERYEQF